tara:strand:+ start:22823 stop:24598 length:1776 start_codon:yes stop_codon:yes gene_type:complete
MTIGKHESKVYLEPIEHVYIHRETGARYKSVTTTLANIEPHFDADGVATAISKQSDFSGTKNEKYIGWTKEQILDYWQELNDTANEYGTFVHETIEEYLIKGKLWFPQDELQKKAIEGYDSLNVDEGQTMWPERIMFAEEYQLAGMADLIIDIDPIFFDVGDWKGLDVNTPILTDSGWKTMGTITTYDKVYDMDGNMVKVLHTSNVKNTPCYKVTFDNNETIVADEDHRWLISFYRDKEFKDAVMTTKELSDYILDVEASGKRWSYKIPKIKITKPLNNYNLNLSIDPYVLGVWLGDGHSVDNKITNMNSNVWSEIERRGYVLGKDVSQGGAGKAQTRTVFTLRKALSKLNLLNNKHIPEQYLLSSYEQRLDLLRGFMDADGYYNASRKRFVMSTTRQWQVEATVQILSSLGIKTTVIPFIKKFNGKDFNTYDICFSTDNLNPFLSRNRTNVEYSMINNKGFKNVISVAEVESVPTRCIEVDSPTSTFLYGHTLSVTHNTNKAFHFHNPYGNETLLKPVEHLQNCQWSIYTLQLSIYAYMYELETGRKCRHIWIGYWDKITETMSKIPIMYLKHEAKQVLELHKYKTQMAV